MTTSNTPGAAPPDDLVLWRIREVAGRSSISQRKVEGLIASKELRAVNAGRSSRVHLDEHMEWTRRLKEASK